MTLLDWGIVVFALSLAVWGYHQGLIVGALTLAGFGVGAVLGSRLGPELLSGGSESPYAPLIAALALGLAWVFGAVALHTPGATELRGDVQRSTILRALNRLLPPSGPILNALNRVDPRRSVSGPPASVGPPDAAIARDQDVIGAGASVVKILGTACGLGVEGSGWAA